MDRELTGTLGRNSIRYDEQGPIPDTTNIYLIDNKAKDIEYLNNGTQANHSNFKTNIIQQQDLDPAMGSSRSITLDERSNWSAETTSYLKSNLININEFYSCNSVKILAQTSKEVYTWVDIVLPEANMILAEVIDMLNYQIFQAYLTTLKKDNLPYSDFGVKFDTRNMSLGVDPENNLIAPGTYAYKGYHADVILMPGCAVDFSNTRLSNILGIRKRATFEPEFIIHYDDLVGGEIPALLDVPYYLDQHTSRPLTTDPDNNSYHVTEYVNGKWRTAYRSWYLAYNTTGSLANQKFLLVAEDLTGGITQLYHCFPDMFKNPVSFIKENSTNMLPIIHTDFLPFNTKEVWSGSAVYSQLVQNSTMRATNVFNRMPVNEIMIQAPAMNSCSLAVNHMSEKRHAPMPIRNSLAGVQRVTTLDDQRRPVPYIVKNMHVITPRVMSSFTL
ncbi:penton [White sturgeon adenovirus 1]|uniref:Penton n=1 Tax=White sturgeon adenovirus 1 TaxID=2580388 RepID=A0A4P8PS93_9ADEN|nr:penton [White sturgeon adenovirus 1]QCQ84154.1 penton [White sturgeon adenovirus 1]